MVKLKRYRICENYEYKKVVKKNTKTLNINNLKIFYISKK